MAPPGPPVRRSCCGWRRGWWNRTGSGSWSRTPDGGRAGGQPGPLPRRGRDVSARRRHAVLVDDERLARRELRTLLEEAHPEQVRVVGEAASVADAARLVHATDADVVFLDIQLAGETGMDLLPLLGVDVDVVFVTAHDAYTLRAFEVNAVDYLLKPVAPERLAVTVGRLAAPQPPGLPRETVTYDDRLLLRLGQERAFV